MSGSKPSHTEICAGCKGEIRERFLLLAVEKYWHTNCLKCSQCGVVLDQVGKSCFVKGTSILCKNDYTRLYRVCTACAKQIPAKAMVLRAGQNVYHDTCFVCSACKRLLKTGDKYCVIDSKLFCEQDAKAKKQQQILQVKCACRPKHCGCKKSLQSNIHMQHKSPAKPGPDCSNPD